MHPDHSDMSLPAVKARLAQIRPVISEMMSVGGAVGLCYGVIHGGQILHRECFGYRDKGRKLAVDSQTIFSIGSMTKGLVTAMLSTLIVKGIFTWDTPVRELLADHAPRDRWLRESATLLDFCSMRSGIEAYNIWSQSDNRISLKKEDAMKVFNTLRSTSDLRSRWKYNNWSYEIAAAVCDKHADKTWDEMLHEQVFDPLDMQRTDARGRRDHLDNQSAAYMVLDDGDPVDIPMVHLSGATLMGPAGGIVSCLDDLLTLYQAVVITSHSQFTKAQAESHDTSGMFGDLTATMSAQSILPGHSYRESTYGLGWIRTELPNQMCKISPNVGMLGTAPVVGEGAQSKLVIAHYGSMPGSYSAVVLFPESESAIVVLTNTTPRCDLADWSTQLLTQTLFDFPIKIDYVKWVGRTVGKELEWHGDLLTELHSMQQKGGPHEALDAYEGHYQNVSKTLSLAIKMSGDRLIVAFDGRDDDTWPLTHAQSDTFSWLQPRNDLVRRARVVGQPLTYYLLRFVQSDSGTMSGLFWAHDSSYLEGEFYARACE